MRDIKALKTEVCQHIRAMIDDTLRMKGPYMRPSTTECARTSAEAYREGTTNVWRVWSMGQSRARSWARSGSYARRRAATCRLVLLSVALHLPVAQGNRKAQRAGRSLRYSLSSRLRPVTPWPSQPPRMALCGSRAMPALCGSRAVPRGAMRVVRGVREAKRKWFMRMAAPSRTARAWAARQSGHGNTAADRLMGRSGAWLGASSRHEAGARCPTGFIFSSSGNRRRSRRNRQVHCWDSGSYTAIDSSCGRTAVRKLFLASVYRQ
jgi:hypothetical protein